LPTGISALAVFWGAIQGVRPSFAIFALPEFAEL
jgi:hypothetical protein